MNSERTASDEVAATGKFPFAKVGIALVIGVALIVGALSLEETRKNRAQMECVSNLDMMNLALSSWALENRMGLTNTYSLNVITAYLKDSALPTCPLGGVYTPGTNLNDTPKCSIPGHTLRFPTPMGGR